MTVPIGPPTGRIPLPLPLEYSFAGRAVQPQAAKGRVMIRIERGAEVDGPKGEGGPRRHGVWEYHVVAYPLVCGYSRQPLLDACRQFKSLYGLTAEIAGVFREGSEVEDVSCVIGKGALLTVSDPSNGKIRFAKFVPFVPFAGRMAKADDTETETEGTAA